MKLDRATAIRQHLFARGQSSIAAIAEAVGASEPTVRRDLLLLEAEGSIVRTHGGARISEGSGVEVAFEAREAINLAAKRAIGGAAHALLRPDAAVFLDAGTTVLQLARQLRLSPVPVRVFTNCLSVAQVLMGVAGVTVTLIGGTLRPQNASTVGLLAEEALGRLWFDQLFLGAGGIALDGAISSADEDEARLNGLMVARAAETVVLADAAKFGSRATFEAARLQPGMRVVTEARLDPGWRRRLADLGCEPILVEAS